MNNHNTFLLGREFFNVKNSIILNFMLKQYPPLGPGTCMGQDTFPEMSPGSQVCFSKTEVFNLSYTLGTDFRILE